MKVLTNTCKRSKFNAQSSSKLNNSSLCKKRCATTITLKTLPKIQQSLQFILFCIRKMILHQIAVKISKTVSFDDIVHFIDEKNIVTYVDSDCGITFYPEIPTKFIQINRERNYLTRSCKNPTAFPPTINTTALLMSSVALISF